MLPPHPTITIVRRPPLKSKKRDPSDKSTLIFHHIIP